MIVEWQIAVAEILVGMEIYECDDYLSDVPGTFMISLSLISMPLKSCDGLVIVVFLTDSSFFLAAAIGVYCSKCFYYVGAAVFVFEAKLFGYDGAYWYYY